MFQLLSRLLQSAPTKTRPVRYVTYFIRETISHSRTVATSHSKNPSTNIITKYPAAVESLPDGKQKKILQYVKVLFTSSTLIPSYATSLQCKQTRADVPFHKIQIRPRNIPLPRQIILRNRPRPCHRSHPHRRRRSRPLLGNRSNHVCHPIGIA